MTNFDINNIEGIDADIETSLKDYGLAWIEGVDEIIFYYGIEWTNKGGIAEYSKFDFCTFKTSMDVKKEFDWVEWNEIYSYTGLDSKQWDSMPITLKINDLYGYYGYINVFGNTYHDGLKYDDIIKGGQKNIMIQSELEYTKEDGTGVHSDLEPFGGCFNNIDKDFRLFLHDCLDEWLNNSNGTGCFYIKDENHDIYNKNDEKTR